MTSNWRSTFSRCGRWPRRRGADRPRQVIDPSIYEMTWVPKGRDLDLEQALLCRIKRTI